MEMEWSTMPTTELHMGDKNDTKKSIAKALEMENLTLDISSNSFSRDLLQRFMGSGSGGARDEEEEDDDENEIELNLGLSMGGRFGVDKSPKKLVRSSSIASCLPVVRDDNDAAATPPAAYRGLARTASLPVETEEEWRKRKELQTLRRMEAKRRRSEKQRTLRSEREGGSGSGNLSLSLEEKKEIEMNLRARLDREKSLTGLKRSGSSLASQLGLSSWAAADAAAMGKGKGSYGGGSQGSVESKGGSSSSISDLETKNSQGSSGKLSPGSIQSAAGSQDIGSSAAKSRETTSKADMESPSKRSDASRARGRGVGAEDMPCVFTKGDGPNGRRVDGILYKYGKGEDVRIMCICHGSFHSPAEFVVHAGGTDTENPLKHIVVNPNASSLV
ncbi:ninja-family protein AFP1-like [Salvia splendens]|uniref:ninja-family protein AFP1-like n=1 Tax=Salvia splendens TaxID=180675 RepID=UPI001C257B46|nr:ninja-family protein AFP1-like [Salvia splendens]